MMNRCDFFAFAALLLGIFPFAEGNFRQTCSSSSSGAFIAWTRDDNICHSVVDYSFYIPDGYSTLALNTVAVSALSHASVLSILPPACRVSLLTAVCSQVFMKCDDQYYSTGSSTSGLPYKRPCSSICAAIARDCHGLLSLYKYNSLIHHIANCSSTTYYSTSTPPLATYYSSSAVGTLMGTYDKSNASSKCNVGPTTKFNAAGSVETYSQSDGVCSGIATELYVFPGNLFNSSLSPIAEQYVVQNATERKLFQIFSSVPDWVSDKCFLSLRKYFCGIYMPAAVQTTSRRVLSAAGINTTAVSMVVGSRPLDYRITLPSYPDISVCEEYESNCGKLADLSVNEIFRVQCRVVTASSYGLSYSLFPSANETMLGRSAPSKISLTSAPAEQFSGRRYTGSEAYVPSCPG